ncbi:MAG: N-acetylmuramoyl-L-alanine amidase, partial [Fidelibacterota bacterium]
MRAIKNIRIIFILLLFGGGSSFAQFLDGASSVAMETSFKREKMTRGLAVSGYSSQYEETVPIEGVAIRFASDSIPREVQFRFQDDNGNWSEFRRGKLFPEPYSNRYIATYRDSALAQSVKFQYRVLIPGGEITLLSGGLMFPDQETYLEGAIPPKVLKSLEVDKPVIITREEWGAHPPKYEYRNQPYFDKLTLHHAAGWAARSLEEGKKQVLAIQEFHQEGRGWNDIGYHFIVDMAGNIYQGRPETVIGAHVGGANTGNTGVCILGCYHPPETNYSCNDQMTDETRKVLIHLYAWISDTYGVNPKVLLGHRDYFGTTSCPGDNVEPLIPPMRADIALYIEFGEQPSRFALYQNYPNPFNSTTTLHYDLPENLSVKLTIFNLRGQEVKTVVNEDQHSGYKKIQWDGTDQQGQRVSTGIYLYRIDMGTYSSVKKMV